MSDGFIRRTQYGIFLSSTNDPIVQKYRNAAHEVISEDEFCHKWYSVEMGSFGPGTFPPIQVCKDKVLSCPIFVGILGPLYGSIATEVSKSYSEYEYTIAKEAKSRNINIFLLPRELLNQEPIDIIEQQGPLLERQKQFRKSVEGTHTTKKVLDLDDFIAKFRQFLRDLAYPPLIIAPESLPENSSDFIGGKDGDTFDTRPVLKYQLADMDQKLIRNFLESEQSQTELGKLGYIRANPQEKLEVLGLIVEERLTLGAFFCFAPSKLIVDKFSSFRLFMVVYSGNDKGSSKTIYKYEHPDNLISLFDEGMMFFRTQLHRIGKVGDSERDELEIPVLALREALANALVHRDYEHLDAKEQPTRLEIYEDRIEIISFGGLVSGVSEDILNNAPEKVIPRRRNPIIARIFLFLTYVELGGSGVKRMHTSMRSKGLPEPKISEEYGCVKVILFRPARDEKPEGFITFLPRDLPPQTVEFVGRKIEMEEVIRSLRSGQSGGISLAVVGMGGVGKSALVAEAIHQLAIDAQVFSGGITWIRCNGQSGLSGQKWVYDQILMRWQISQRPIELVNTNTLEEQIEQREQVFRDSLVLPGSALIYLDNVEQGLPLVRMLELFLTLNISIILTSRTIPTTPRLQIISLNVLVPEAAIDLFALRYKALGGDWEELRDKFSTLVVVELLGYLPLAIELAAARAARIKWSVTRLVQELREPNVLSKLNDPIDPTSSVRYILFKSLDLLTPTQRTCFAALGLPEGSDWPQPIIYTLLVSILSATSGEENSAEEALELLTALSLITLSTYYYESRVRPIEIPLRVHIHPLLRALAEEEWKRQPEEFQIAGAIGLLAGVVDFIKNNEQDFVLLQQEEELCIGAIKKAVNMHVAPREVIEAANRLSIEAVNRLSDYLYIGGHWQLGLDLYQTQLVIQRQIGDIEGEAATLRNLGVLAYSLARVEEAENYYQQALAISRKQADRQHEGAILKSLGVLAYSLGNVEETKSYYQQALIISREQNDRQGEGAILKNLGILAYSLGHVKEAEDYYQQALVISREVGDRQSEGVILKNLGVLTYGLGRVEETESYYQQALVISREESDWQSEGAILKNLGSLAYSLGRVEETENNYQQALAISRGVGDRQSEGDILNNLGGLTYSLGRTKEAEGYYQQALTILQEVGDRRSEGDILNNLGSLAYSLGRVEEAENYYQQALASSREVGDRQSEGDILNNLGSLADFLDQVEEAESYYQQALAISQMVGDRRSEASALKNLGNLKSTLGNVEEAEDYYKHALAVLRDVGDRRREGDILKDLGSLAYSRERKDEALLYYQMSLKIFEEIGMIQAAEEAWETISKIQSHAKNNDSGLSIEDATEEQLAVEDSIVDKGLIHQRLFRWFRHN